MFVTELDTFVEKFKSLWRKGLEAHLDVDTQAGHAWVGLRVQLGHEPGPPLHDYPPCQERKQKQSPSRQRRRERRAVERKTAEEAKRNEHVNTDVVVEETTTQENVKAGEAPTVDTEQDVNKEVENSAVIAEVCETNEALNDEFCSDASFKHDDKEDTIIEEILVVLKKKSDEDKEDLENSIDYNLKILGINMLKITRKSESDSTAFTVKIAPTSLGKIKDLNFQKEEFSVKPMKR